MKFLFRDAISLRGKSLLGYVLKTSGHTCVQHYTPIAFDERVTFWFQYARSLPCACVLAALYACAIA